MRIGLIGYGNMGGALARLLDADPDTSGTVLRVLVREGRSTPHDTVHDIASLLADPAPDLVIECAGHDAVTTFCAATLERGIDMVVASIGALADDRLRARLAGIATRSGARLILPAGAIGGLDLLSALRPAGITEVIYEGRKPPAAWKGSPAEAAADLDRLSTALTFFEGSARDAARAYPRNANVAAAVALAGIGFDRTRARLIADPAAPGNMHGYSVRAAAANYRIDITGIPSAHMPRTSAATVLSLFREVRNRLGPIAI